MYLIIFQDFGCDAAENISYQYQYTQYLHHCSPFWLLTLWSISFWLHHILILWTLDFRIILKKKGNDYGCLLSRGWWGCLAGLPRATRLVSCPTGPWIFWSVRKCSYRVRSAGARHDHLPYQTVPVPYVLLSDLYRIGWFRAHQQWRYET